MKLLYTNNKIKLKSDNITKEYDSFILCDNDDELSLLKQSGYTEVSEILNIEQMETIRETIENQVKYIKNKSEDIDNLISELNKKVSELDNNNANLFVLIEEYSSKFIDIQQKTEEINGVYNNILSVSELLQNKLDNFNNLILEIVNEKVESFENITEKIKDNAEFELQEYNKILSKLQTILDTGKEYLKELVVESQKYSELSKKWACNPVNVVVENDLYSSKHYAETLKNIKE